MLFAKHHSRPLLAALIPAGLVSLLILHLIIEQFRWILLPVYGLTAVIIASSIIKSLRQGSRRLGRVLYVLLSILALFAGILSFGMASLLPLFQFTKPSGPYNVGVLDYTWTDSDRALANGTARQLNVRIWYPASDASTTPASYIPQVDLFIQAVKKEYGLWSRVLSNYRTLEIPAQYAAPFYPSADPVPAVIYLHGNQLGTRFTGTFQALELASSGYMVIGLEHPGTAFLSVFSKDSYVPFTHSFVGIPEEFEAHNTIAIPLIQEMQTDVRFVLQQLQQLGKYEPDSPIANRIDPNRVAIIGHSFGGAAAADMLFHSTIIKAAINLDGYLYGSYPSEPEQKPLLILNGGLEIAGLEETMTGLEEERAIRNRIIGEKGLEITLPQAGHLSFTDLPLYSPLFKPLAPDSRTQHRLINEYTLRFLQEHL